MRNLISSLMQLNPDRRPSINEVLKSSIITNRIKNYLSESIRKIEFAHTILHN